LKKKSTEIFSKGLEKIVAIFIRVYSVNYYCELKKVTATFVFKKLWQLIAF